MDVPNEVTDLINLLLIYNFLRYHILLGIISENGCSQWGHCEFVYYKVYVQLHLAEAQIDLNK